MIVYAGNSMMGGYSLFPETLRRFDSNSNAISYKVVVNWQPRYGEVSAAHRTFLGILFYPLVRIDQRFIHKGYDLLNPEDEAAVRNLPAFKIHPHSRGKR